MRIIIRNLQKQIPITAQKIKRTAFKVLQSEGIKKTGQLNLFFVSDAKIKELNLRYKGEDCATDVLSFDLSGSKKQALWDIVISADTAKRNAAIFKTSPKYEIHLYVIHAILHLLGYRDYSKLKRAQMEIRQKRILKILNL